MAASTMQVLPLGRFQAKVGGAAESGGGFPMAALQFALLLFVMFFVYRERSGKANMTWFVGKQDLHTCEEDKQSRASKRKKRGKKSGKAQPHKSVAKVPDAGAPKKHSAQRAQTCAPEAEVVDIEANMPVAPHVPAPRRAPGPPAAAKGGRHGARGDRGESGAVDIEANFPAASEAKMRDPEPDHVDIKVVVPADSENKKMRDTEPDHVDIKVVVPAVPEELQHEPEPQHADAKAAVAAVREEQEEADSETTRTSDAVASSESAGGAESDPPKAYSVYLLLAHREICQRIERGAPGLEPMEPLPAPGSFVPTLRPRC